MIREAIESIDTTISLSERKFSINHSRIMSVLELMMNGCVPIHPGIMKKFEFDVPEAYHITSFYGLKNLIEVQGSKSQIPSFTKGDMAMLEILLEDSQVVVKLKGKSGFVAPSDLASIIGENGYRWLNPDNFVSDYIYENFTFDMREKIVKRYKLEKGTFFVNQYIIDQHQKHKLDGDNGPLHEFIQFYIDTAKKLITDEFLKGLALDMAKYNDHYISHHNELLVHKVKILEVQEIQYSGVSNDDTIKHATKGKVKIGKPITPREIDKIDVKL